MHEGALPGYAASHGCVRLPHEFARRLFGITEGNERVIITHQDIAPFAISHPHLFVPKFMEVPGQMNVASGSSQILQNAIAVTQDAQLAGDAQKVEVAAVPGVQDGKADTGGQKLLNPVEFAKTMRRLAAQRAEEATAALTPARKAIDAKAKEVLEVASAVRKAEIALASAKDTLDAAERRIKKAAADEQEANAAAEAKVQAEAKLAGAEATLSAAQRAKAERSQDGGAGKEQEVAEAKTKEAREAAIAVRKAANALDEAKGQLETAERRVKHAGTDTDAAKAAADVKAQAETKVSGAGTALSAAQQVKAAKDQDAGDARNAAEAKAKALQEASQELRKAENALSNARDQLAATERRTKRAAGEVEASKGGAEAKALAEPKVTEAEAALSAAQRVKAGKDREAADSQKAFKDADAARREAANAAKSWERRLAPLSIFVSRKTQRLYIRQGRLKVFDVPVAIRDPEKPLGTHVFIAMPAQGSEPQLHWLALTVPEAGTGDDEPRRRRRSYDDGQDGAPVSSGKGVSAAEALDRIEVASEVREKISEMLWAGSSLIVSDKPMSGETGDSTDFIILTR